MSKGLTLYEIAGDLQVLHDAIMEAEGEVTDEVDKALDGLGMMLADKVEAIGRWTINLAGTTDAIDAEIARLQARKKRMTNLQARLKEYVKLCMMKSDKAKLEFPAFAVRVQRNPPSVEVADEAKLPAKFIRIKQITEVDKKGLLDALKAGEQVPGAILVNDKTHLRIV